MPSTTDQTLTIEMRDGATIYAKLLGFENPEMPLIITHHGAPGASDHSESATSYDFLRDRFRVLLFDARGSGASANQKGPYTLAQFVSDLEDLRQWANVEHFVLGGGSYGGAVALCYAIKHQNRLTGMILRDTFADGRTMLSQAFDAIINSDRLNVDKELQERLWVFANVRSDEEYAKGLIQMAPIMPFDPSNQNVSVQAAGVEPVFAHRTFNEAFGVDLKQYNVVDQLQEIQVPTLVVVGKHDKLTSPINSEIIANGIPNAILAVFENSGHSPPAEEPEEWRACVTDFLNTLYSASN